MNTILVLAFTVFVAALLYAHFVLHLTLAEVKAKLHLLHTAVAPVTLSPLPVADGSATAIASASSTALIPQPTHLPNGIAWADMANGLVSIVALEQYYPGRKYAVKQTEGYVAPGSAAFYALVQNIQNCTFAAAHDMIQYGVFHPAKPNGLTNGYSLDTSINIDGAFVCPDDQPTYDSVVTWLSAIAQANAANPHNSDGGAGFTPNAKH